MMKLITEQIEPVEVLTEDKDGKKNTFIKGVFLQTEITNRNGRMYKYETMAREVNKYNEEFVRRGRALASCPPSQSKSTISRSCVAII